MSADTFPAGICRICCCTETNGCAVGCSWTDDSRTLCSLCEEAQVLAQQIVEIFGKVGPRARTPIHGLPAPAWGDLTFEQQQLLVVAHRRLVDATRELLIDEISQDAFDSMVALRAIVQFLAQCCPQHLQADEPVDQLVIRLLEPHVGTRIVLSGGPLV